MPNPELARLIDSGLKEKLCEKCGNMTWMGQVIPLKLCYVDGNPENGNLDNLRLLCLNCYAVFGVDI